MAEHVWGACKGPDPFIVVELGDGIGLSVFMNGSFIKGTTDIFGEMGHTVYREDGDICKCGNRGCLETFAGRSAIINKVKENLADNLGFFRKSFGSSFTFEDICSNAAEENKLALLVLRDAAKAIGDTIANVVNVLGITRVVLYGETVKAGTVLTDEIQNSIRKHCIYPLNQGSEIILSGLDVFASASGAAFFAIDKFFNT
ncbi:MAG: ROK family protein [Spirochaetales bacterium]|nr:MAG: ROK family protein [Spirochaetales bacterium]